MTRRRLAALLVIALPQAALARPATVRVFEAAAHAEPSPEAAVLHLFPERAEVSVSEEAKDGWLRVRLEDGRVGWIEESALAFPGSLAPAAAEPPSPLPATDLRPRIYVKDLAHLAELVKGDPAVSPQAEALARRRRAAVGVFIAGAAVGTALVVAALRADSPDPRDPGFDRSLDTQQKMLTGAALTVCGTALLGGAVYPGRGEVIDLLNAWNVAHPDRQFELQGHGHRAHGRGLVP